MLKAGDRIHRYVVDGLLGSGGMGEVYRAHDARLQRSVALKILRRDPSATGGKTTDGAARMLREARAAAALQHPNVVAIHDVGELDEPEELRGTTYLAMELVKGAPLRSYVGDASVPTGTRLRWLIDVARALACAHAAGLVHRDVKPENVMIREDGIAKVLDFGIAKRTVEAAVDPRSSTEGYMAPTSTAVGAIVGTPMYMAPEQLRAEAVDGRVDQFAWGVLAYELLAGKPPWSFEGGTIALIGQILAAKPAPIGQLAEVPPEVASAVMRALAKERDDRFPSMEALLVAIGGAEESRAASLPRGPTSRPDAVMDSRVSAPTLPISPEDVPRKPAALDRAGAPAGRKRWVAASIVGLVVVGAVVAARRGASPIAAPPAPDAGAITPRAGGCAGQAECVASHGGEPWTCRASDGACVKIASEDCEAKFEPTDLASSEMVWIGAMLPLKGKWAEAYGTLNLQTLDLARRDFANVGGIPASTEGRMRPIGLVACDLSVDPRRAAKHLADVSVSAVIGFPLPVKDTIDLVSNVLLPAGVLSYEVFGESPLITHIPQPPGSPRLVWRLTKSATETGEAMGHLITDYVEPALHRPGGPLQREGSTKLAIVRRAGNNSSAVIDALTSAVRLNGKPLVENNGLFRELTFREGASRAETNNVVADLVAFAPHVIAYDGLIFEESLLSELEGQWRAPYRPVYVSSAGQGDEPVMRFVGSSTERRHRFLSVELPANTSENFAFVRHYNELFDPKITPGTAPGAMYDAFYVAAYAASVTRKPRVTGHDLASAMARLGGDAPRISVGPTQIFEAYEVLRSGGAIHLAGAGTQLDFDHATGELPTDFAVYCLGVDRNGKGSDSVESGLRFDHVNKSLEGSLICP